MIALLLACGAPEPVAPDGPRLVAIGPAVAEIAHRLMPGSLVGIDDSSRELAGLAGVATVGFSRTVSAEGVLSLGPERVLAVEHAGPPEALDLVRSAGIPVDVLPHERSPDGVRALIRSVADAIGRPSAELEAELDARCAAIPAASGERAVFVYAPSGGAPRVSGTDTAAHAMLGLAGLTNAVDGYAGYKPLTPEAALAANPDRIVLTTKGLAALGGPDGLAAIPGLGLTDAVRAGRVATVDDLELLAFGLGACDAARALAEQVAR